MAYEDYWIKRAERRMADRQKAMDASILQIDNAYHAAMAELDKEIYRLFLQFVSESRLTPSAAKKMLQELIPEKEMAGIRDQIGRIENAEIKKALQQKLDAARAQARISRQAALQEAIQIKMSVLADKEQAISTTAYTQAIRQEYLRNIFDSQQYLGFAFNFTELPDRVIDQILQDDWSKKHYSARIWSNTQTMAQEIEKIILKGTLLGTNSRKMAKELHSIADTGMYACELLIRTETTYFTAMADLEAAKARGTTQVKFVATLDSRTSDQCQKADGTVIQVADALPGKNIPPLHPFCRSVIIDVIGGLVHKVRRARNPNTGQIYLVPADMTYAAWSATQKDHIILKESADTTKKYGVCWDRINTPKWERKFDNLSGQPEADAAIQKYTKKILINRDGTNTEETYLLDARSGKVLGHIIGREKVTEFGPEQVKLLIDAPDNSIILLHNHPSGGSFTLTDIESICGVGSVKGIVAAGHNGYIYYADRPPYRADIGNIFDTVKNLYAAEKPINIRHKTWSTVSATIGMQYERR